MNDRRRLGLVLAGIGLVVLVIGTVATAIGNDDKSLAAVTAAEPPTTTAAEPPTTTAAEPPTTTAAEPPTTTAAEPPTESTEVMPSTSSTTARPASTTAPTAPVEEFVDDFVAAIENGDAHFLVETLHPLVVQEFTVELCSAFIEREILTLTDYRRTGEINGPDERAVLGTLIENFYEAPVRFGFQGQTFDSRATFTLADSAVSWFAECR